VERATHLQAQLIDQQERILDAVIRELESAGVDQHVLCRVHAANIDYNLDHDRDHHQDEFHVMLLKC
jgi:hypothetical protein